MFTFYCDRLVYQTRILQDYMNDNASKLAMDEDMI